MAVRDYSKGKIYKIVVDTDEEYKPYVGSTIQGLAERMGGHRDKYKLWKNGKQTNCSSFDLFNKFGVNNCKIILLEEYPCDSKMKLLMKEREWFDKMNCCNKIKPFINKEEFIEQKKIYRNEHKEEISEYNKIYYESIKEQIFEKRKKIYTCSCDSILTIGNKPRHEKTQKHQNWVKSL